MLVLVWHANAIWSCQHCQVTDPQMFYDTSFATTPVLHTKDWKIDDIDVNTVVLDTV